MTDRTTQRHLQVKLEQIKDKTGIKLAFSKWTPDKQSHYELYVDEGNGKHGRQIGRIALGASEAYDMLKAIVDFIEIQQSQLFEKAIDCEYKESVAQ